MSKWLLFSKLKLQAVVIQKRLKSSVEDRRILNMGDVPQARHFDKRWMLSKHPVANHQVLTLRDFECGAPVPDPRVASWGGGSIRPSSSTSDGAPPGDPSKKASRSVFLESEYDA